jgi:hypothetical protein
MVASVPWLLIGDHDHRRRPQPHDLVEEFDAVHIRHLDIERHDVRVERLHCLARLERISRLADHFDFRIAQQSHADQTAHRA